MYKIMNRKNREGLMKLLQWQSVSAHKSQAIKKYLGCY